MDTGAGGDVAIDGGEGATGGNVAIGGGQSSGTSGSVDVHSGAGGDVRVNAGGAVSVESLGEGGRALGADGNVGVSGAAVRVQGSETTTVRGGEVRVESDASGVSIGSGAVGSGPVVVQGPFKRVGKVIHNFFFAHPVHIHIHHHHQHHHHICGSW